MNDDLGRKRSEKKQALIASAQYKADDRHKITCLMKQDLLGGSLEGFKVIASQNQFSLVILLKLGMTAYQRMWHILATIPRKRVTTQHSLNSTASSKIDSLAYDNTLENARRSPVLFLSSTLWLRHTFPTDTTF